MKIENCFILLGLILIGIGSLMILNASIIKTETNITQIKEMGSLEKIIRPIVENTTIEGGNCLKYTLYYQDYLNKTDYKLDVRKINRAVICPIGTKQCGDMEGKVHTYLIINGYGGECILDQYNLVCIQVRDEV